MDRSEYMLSRIFGKTLDVGFYFGSLHKKIKKIVPKENLYGIDTVTKGKLGKNFKKADAEKKIPFKNNLFDTIVAGEVIEHLHKPEIFVKESNRVLKIGGTAIITTPNRDSFINRVFKSYFAPLHFTLFNRKELHKLLTDNGFEIEDYRCFPYTEESCDGSRLREVFVLRKVMHKFLPIDLQENMCFVVKKIKTVER